MNAEGKTPLFLAVYYNRLIAVKCLIEKGSNVNHKDNNNSIPLHFASTKGN